ncbi:hypothetical protein EXIGLDRAFT_733343 [Exidia glandulosa HHB12029]|uniref:Uncharacterized protein n=1 Tax=Exidia glandulosa HHB12029 TaxID=1314781 RepID=A0A165KJF4_EXIGL|nr:hypothetical protein EXIGLDRAFT_733343 [Exidia glandulosa HHB12029]
MIRERTRLYFALGLLGCFTQPSMGTVRKEKFEHDPLRLGAGLYIPTEERGLDEVGVDAEEEPGNGEDDDDDEDILRS